MFREQFVLISTLLFSIEIAHILKIKISERGLFVQDGGRNTYFLPFLSSRPPLFFLYSLIFFRVFYRNKNNF